MPLFRHQLYCTVNFVHVSNDIISKSDMVIFASFLLIYFAQHLLTSNQGFETQTSPAFTLSHGRNWCYKVVIFYFSLNSLQILKGDTFLLVAYNCDVSKTFLPIVKRSNLITDMREAFWI